MKLPVVPLAISLSLIKRFFYGEKYVNKFTVQYIHNLRFKTECLDIKLVLAYNIRKFD